MSPGPILFISGPNSERAEDFVMEKACVGQMDCRENDQKEEKTYTPFPGADEKYDDGSDWRLYNPDKYRDPNWSPDKE
jgi:hypothetical protein